MGRRKNNQNQGRIKRDSDILQRRTQLQGKNNLDLLGSNNGGLKQKRMTSRGHIKKYI